MERRSPEMQDIIGQRSVLMKWRKIGGGTFRLGSGKIIKSGQVFESSLEDIPQSFRDTVIALNPSVISEEKAEEEIFTLTSQPQTKYEIRKRSETGFSNWYDVVNVETGKLVNEKAMRKTKAEEILAELEG